MVGEDEEERKRRTPVLRFVRAGLPILEAFTVLRAARGREMRDVDVVLRRPCGSSATATARRESGKVGELRVPHPAIGSNTD